MRMNSFSSFACRTTYALFSLSESDQDFFENERKKCVRIFVVCSNISGELKPKKLLYYLVLLYFHTFSHILLITKKEGMENLISGVKTEMWEMVCVDRDELK